MNSCTTKIFHKNVSRRGFLQGMVGVSVAAASISLPFKVQASATKNDTNKEIDKEVWSACLASCGGRCPLRLQIKDGVVVRVEADNSSTADSWGTHQARACARGRSIRQRMYSPDRVKYPLKRVGTRGSGEFKRISWEEALDTIAASIKKTYTDYGPEAIFLPSSTGSFDSWFNLHKRLFGVYGGFLNGRASYSTSGYEVGGTYTFGGGYYGGPYSNNIVHVAKTKLVVMFGNNPAETRNSGASVTHNLTQAREISKARLIVIDPRYSDSCMGREDEWVPIRPGTDAAFVAGMAHVILTENLQDQDFLDRCVVGFDEATLPTDAPKNSSYKSYIMGFGEDGIEKTPKWAASITGIPEDTILRLAREIASAKPAFISQGWGIARQRNGEASVRAICTLAAMTGNIGVAGGNTGLRERINYLWHAYASIHKNDTKTSIPLTNWTEAVTRYAELTPEEHGITGADKLSAPIKLIFAYASNALVNQNPNITKASRVLQDTSLVEMVVVADSFMTATAQHADIVLPITLAPERYVYTYNEGSADMGYVIAGSPAVEAPFEARTEYWMFSELAKRLNIEQAFTEGRTEEQWLEWAHNLGHQYYPQMVTWEQLKKQGIDRIPMKEAHDTVMKDFRENPNAHPLKTQSGKIEIYSQSLAELAKTRKVLAGDKITALPEYIITGESHLDHLTETYPLQLLTYHGKGATNSQYRNLPVLLKVSRQDLWINPHDAKTRNIKNGDTIEVFNDRGRIQLIAKVTARILPGVVASAQGAWFRPNAEGVCLGGNINVLTVDHTAPIGFGSTTHTNLVEIKTV